MEGTKMSDNSKTKRDLLLSEYLAKNNGYITDALLCTYRNKAKALLSKEAKTEDEQLFAMDFVSSVVEAKINDKRVEDQVMTRSRSQAAGASTSRAGPNSVNQNLVLTAPPGPAGFDQNQPATIRLNELVVTPEKFNGQRGKARRWLDNYERAGRSNSWSDATKAKYFQTYLSDSAVDWFAVQIQSDDAYIPTWQEVKLAFTNYFIGEDEDLALERELKDAVQGSNEGSGAFIARYARLLSLSDPKMSPNRQMGAIRIRLRPEIVERLAGYPLSTLADLNTACSGIEDALNASRAALELRRSSKTGGNAVDNGRREDRRKGGQPAGKKDTRVCHRCDRPGHIREKCFSRTKADGSKLTDPAPATRPADSRKINAIEEVSSDEEPPEVKITRASKSVGAIIVNNCEKKKKRSRRVLIMWKVAIGEQILYALIDPGSEVSIINAESASLYGWVPQGPIPELATADSNPIKCFGMVELNFSLSIGGTTKTIERAKFLVVDNLCRDVILGIEMLRWLRVIVDPAEMTIYFKKEPKESKLKGLQVVESVTLPARSQAVVKTTVPAGIVGAIQTVRFNTGSDALLVANSISEIKEGVVDCLCTNLDNKDVVLNVGQRIASYELLPKLGQTINAVEAIGESEAFVTVGDCLSDVQIAQLMQVINQHQAAFSVHGELGCTDVVEHDIELVDGAKPSVEPLRRRPQAHRDEARKQIQDMLSKGIIEESSSPWSSAYVLAKKKSGEMRLCVDFRRLNELTKKDVYPIPNADECVEQLAGKKFFSQLDMASGFWQLPLTARAREMTAFRSDEGHYQFRRMPFGLTNAPSSFQRLVNILFAGLRGLNLQIFMDDVCLATSTWQEHIELLAKVFQLLVAANLKLKPNKCSFGVDKVIFLGHEISNAGIRQDPTKLAAIRALPSPRNLRELRGVLGLLNYYRKFVPSFAMIIEPMCRLLKKGVQYVWTQIEETCLRRVIEILLENGTLAHFNPRAPTALKTDACKTGIASILLQSVDGEWRIVTCLSRRLTPAESNYGITELEALAVIYSVTTLRHYLLGVRFKIISDHCALCSVFKNPSNSERLNRWRLALADFEYDVIYTKGAMHSDVDCLSRLPLPEETDTFLEEKLLAACVRPPLVAAIPIVSPLALEEWVEMTASDEEAKQFLIKAKHRRDGFKLVRDCLYKNNRLFVPMEKRKKIVEAAHASASAGHGGIKSTLSRLEAFWWPSITRDVTKTVESCLTCQMRKIPRALPAGEMRSHVAHAPLELVQIDCLGKLPDSQGRKGHIIVAVDCFTRFVAAKAIKNVRGSSIAKFISEWVGVFGAPKILVTDQAPSFVNEIVRAVSDKFGISHRHGTPHHHESQAVVERMIGSLTDKLSMAVNEAEPGVDWETLLPQTVLAMNTSVCSSTNFSPYQLMFGRRHKFLPQEFDTEESTCEQDVAAEVIGRQSDARATSKQRYDACHRQLSYDDGALVLAKRMGRINKLANRFDGPFEVISSENDIYQLRSLNNKKIIERHVRDMKKFVPVTCAIVAALVSYYDWVVNTTIVFDRAPPILWTEARQFVTPGIANYSLRLDYISPCEVLREIEDIAKIPDAITECEQVFREQIERRVGQFIRWADGRQPSPLLPTPPSAPLYDHLLDPAVPASLPGQEPHPELLGLYGNHHLTQLPKPGGPTLGPQHHQDQSYKIPIYPPTRSQRAGRMLHFPEGISLAASLQSVTGPPVSANPAHPRHKRDLGLGGVMAYSFVSTVLETVLNRVWSQSGVSDLREHQSEITKAIFLLRNSMNVTELTIQAVQSALANQAALLDHNVANVNYVQYQHPKLMVTISHLVAKMAQLGANIEKLRQTFAAQRVDPLLLNTMLNTSMFTDMEPESILRRTVKAWSLGPSTILLEFKARMRDPNTTVYQVDAFRFWADLTEAQPMQHEYAGPGYLIYNASSHCVKGIADPKALWVNARCTEPGYEDPALSRWKRVTATHDPWGQPAQTQVKEGVPFVYLYCFTLDITIGGEVQACPPFVFKLAWNIPWQVSDNYTYTPDAVEVVARDEVVLNHVHSVHFRNQSQAVDEIRAIRQINKYRAELQLANSKLMAFTFGQTGGMSYPTAVVVLGCLFTVTTAALIYRNILHERRLAARHKETICSIADGRYAAQIYETLNRRGQGFKLINLRGVPRTADPLPTVPQTDSQLPVVPGTGQRIQT